MLVGSLLCQVELSSRLLGSILVHFGVKWGHFKGQVGLSTELVGSF